MTGWYGNPIGTGTTNSFKIEDLKDAIAHTSNNNNPHNVVAQQVNIEIVSGLTSNNVQDAIEEINNKLDNISAGADVEEMINSALSPIKQKTNLIVSTGNGSTFLSNDGTYKNVVSNVNSDWNSISGSSMILNKPTIIPESGITEMINTSITPIKNKTDKIITNGSGLLFLSNDGTYKSSDSTSNIIEEETLIGEYNVGQYEYNLYTMAFELNSLPKTSGQSSTYVLAQTPIGFNTYLNVNSFSVSPMFKNNSTIYVNQKYTIERIYVDSDLKTKIEIVCLKTTSLDLKAVVKIDYIKDFGEIVEFDVYVPSGVSKESVQFEFPKLKYNKKVLTSLTVDDSYSVYNGFFAPVNKRWVDDELMSFWNSGDTRSFTHHLDMNVLINGQYWNKTSGYYPSKFLEYTDGAGVRHRFACSVAAWSWKLADANPNIEVMRNQDVGIMYPWISAKEARYFQDFGYTLNYHDIKGVADYSTANGTTAVGSKLFNQFLQADAEQFLTLTDRYPKVMQGANGDPNYIYLSRTCPTVQYNMEIANRGTDSICVPFKPFNNTYFLDYKLQKYLVQRFFYTDTYNFKGWANSVINEYSLPESGRTWQVLGMHRMTRNTDNSGTTITQAITQMEESIGASGNDSLWFPSIDEVYEYWFMTTYGLHSKTVYTDRIHYKLYLPCLKNSWFKSVSCLLDGINSLSGVTVVSSDNCNGTSYAISDNKLLINLDFNSDLLTKAEKYVSIFENNPQKEYAYDDAVYFTQLLKSGVKEPFQNRIDSFVGSPVLTSFLINSGNTDTYNNIVNLNIGYSGATPTNYMISQSNDFSGAQWITFTSNITYSFTQSSYGTKTLYCKIKNNFGESSVLNDSINYLEPMLVLNSISINSGDTTTSNTLVNIGFNYQGTPTDYMLSEDQNFVGANWISFVNNPTFSLSGSTYGLKTVYAKLKNSTSESQVVSDTIELIDTTSVSLNSIVINSGEAETISSTVNVKFNITNTATHYRLGITSDLSLIPWIEYTSNEVQFTLPSYGNNTVYGQVKNSTSESLIQSDSINLLEPVTLNSMLINNGDVSTSSNPITFVFNYSGGTPTHYMVSEDSGFTTSNWINYFGQPISYLLSNTSAGFKTLYLKVKNNVGESNVVSDTIEYVVSAQKVVISMNDSGVTNNNIVYDISTPVTINRINMSTFTSYSPKQFRDTTNTVVDWYLELKSDTFYPKNSETNITGTYLNGASQYSPVLTGNTGVYPDFFITKNLAINGLSYDSNATPSIASKKGRIVFTLPNGTYTFKMLWSPSSGFANTEDDLKYLYYRVDASGVVGTPTRVGQPGFVAFGNTQFNSTIENVVVTNGGTSGNVIFYVYNTKPAALYYRPGINLIEITKTS